MKKYALVSRWIWVDDGNGDVCQERREMLVEEQDIILHYYKQYNEETYETVDTKEPTEESDIVLGYYYEAENVDVLLYYLCTNQNYSLLLTPFPPSADK